MYCMNKKRHYWELKIILYFKKQQILNNKFLIFIIKSRIIKRLSKAKKLGKQFLNLFLSLNANILI